MLTDTFIDKAWEEVPDEDLWADGERDSDELKHYIYYRVIQKGDWKLIRRSDDK